MHLLLYIVNTIILFVFNQLPQIKVEELVGLAQNFLTNFDVDESLFSNVAISLEDVKNKTEFRRIGYYEAYNDPYQPGGNNEYQPSYYELDFYPVEYVHYAILTLDNEPNSSDPNNKYWDGNAIYDSNTKDDILKTLDFDNVSSPYHKQSLKLEALMKAAKIGDKKLIWTIGGSSDLLLGMKDEQVGSFVSKCIQILQKGGDGIDLDFEHISASNGASSQMRKEMAQILITMKKGFDNIFGPDNKKIIYTTRFNAFWGHPGNDRPTGYKPFDSDYEAIDITNNIYWHDNNLNLKDLVDYVQIQFYDEKPVFMNTGPDGLRLVNYQQVLTAASVFIPKEKIVMGFKPGDQQNGGVWEGSEVDESVIDYMKENGYGGVMFWALNQPGPTGEHVSDIAAYAAESE